MFCCLAASAVCWNAIAAVLHESVRRRTRCRDRPVERAAFGMGADPNSSTLVAFQFFGHPAMHLERWGFAAYSVTTRSLLQNVAGASSGTTL